MSHRSLYVALLLFAKTRKRQLIDLLFQHGMCLSYDRVLEISTQLGDSVVSTYLEEGVVCPAVLQKGIFTTSAVNNIDIILLVQQLQPPFMEQAYRYSSTQPVE